MKLSMYQLSIENYVYRFILMMAIVIAGVMLHQFYLLVFAPIVFLSMMLGVKISRNRRLKS